MQSKTTASQEKNIIKREKKIFFFLKNTKKKILFKCIDTIFERKITIAQKEEKQKGKKNTVEN